MIVIIVVSGNNDDQLKIMITVSCAPPNLVLAQSALHPNCSLVSTLNAVRNTNVLSDYD